MVSWVRVEPASPLVGLPTPIVGASPPLLPGVLMMSPLLMMIGHDEPLSAARDQGAVGAGSEVL
jgi:hypothetical protein